MMKNNKTESEIFEQIKESLGHYEEAYIPGSWENFLQKRRDHNRKIFLRIASGIAACLLVGFLGLNYFQAEFRSEKRDLSVATAEQSEKSDNSAATALQSEKSDKSVAAADQVANITGENADSEKKITGEAPSATMIAATDVKPVTVVRPGSEVKSGSDLGQSGSDDKKSVTNGRQSGFSGAKTAPKTERKSTLTAEEQKKIPNQQMAAVSAPESKDQVAALPPGTKQQSGINKADTTKGSPDTTKSKTENIYLNIPQPGDQQPLAAAEKRKVRIGINFSPGVNTTEPSSSLNYMGGISADIPLSSRVDLSTGLQFENQSFVKKMPGIVSAANAPVNQTKTTVTNLDFPVNITWKFAAEKKHAYYVSAGLSSLVYLSQENKNTTYSQDLIPVSSLVNGEEIKSYSILSTVSVTQDAVTPEQAFDPAGRVNLMVGYETKLSNRIYIHFEPYAKFPTSSQEAGSLNHTTTGINFKISF